jgi:hypothetical protein
MKTADRACDPVICLLSHALLNKVSVVIGHCELLQEPDQSPDQIAAHLAEIQIAAKAMAESLRQCQCFLAQTADPTSPIVKHPI